MCVSCALVYGVGGFGSAGLFHPRRYATRLDSARLNSTPRRKTRRDATRCTPALRDAVGAARRDAVADSAETRKPFSVEVGPTDPRPSSSATQWFKTYVSTDMRSKNNVSNEFKHCYSISGLQWSCE